MTMLDKTPTPTAGANGAAPGSGGPVVAVRRRTIDTVLVLAGIVVTAVLIAAGALLTWGSNFAEDYVHDELSAQHIQFPDAAALEEDNPALIGYADAIVDTGPEAEAYAAYIDGHLAATADGATYADLGGPQREAREELQAAQDEGGDEATVAELQATFDEIWDSATRCSEVRRSAACCCRRSPGRRSAASPASPPPSPSWPLR